MTEEVNFLLEMINLAQTSFKKDQRKIERIYFPSGIYSGLPLPEEDLNEEKAIYADFQNRFIISIGTLATAIVEYEIKTREWIPHSTVWWIATKNIIYNNVIKLREEVISFTKLHGEMQYNIDSPFFTDNEPSYLNDAGAKERYMALITQKAEETKRYIEDGGEFRNLYYHFYPALGELLPDSTHPGNNIQVVEFLNKNISETIATFEVTYLNNRS